MYNYTFTSCFMWVSQVTLAVREDQLELQFENKSPQDLDLETSVQFETHTIMEMDGKDYDTPEQQVGMTQGRQNWL